MPVDDSPCREVRVAKPVPRSVWLQRGGITSNANAHSKSRICEHCTRTPKLSRDAYQYLKQRVRPLTFVGFYPIRMLLPDVACPPTRARHDSQSRGGGQRSELLSIGFKGRQRPPPYARWPFGWWYDLLDHVPKQRLVYQRQTSKVPTNWPVSHINGILHYLWQWRHSLGLG